MTSWAAFDSSISLPVRSETRTVFRAIAALLGRLGRARGLGVLGGLRLLLLELARAAFLDRQLALELGQRLLSLRAHGVLSFGASANPATLRNVSGLPPDAEQHGTVPAVEPEGDAILRRRRAKLYAWAFLLAAFFVILVALIVENTRSVKISWVVGSGHASLIWIIIVAALLGWLSGIVTSLLFHRRTRRRA